MPPEFTRIQSPLVSPTVLRMVLGAELRRLREAKGIPVSAAAEVIRASGAKISRLELGRVGCKQRDVADLLALYGIDDPRERNAYLSLAERASAPGWWQNYGGVLPTWFEMYVGLEQGAVDIRTYQVQFVPGLFQTRAYAQAVIGLNFSGEKAADTDLRVELRMARQELLTGSRGPQIWAVLDEAALRRPIGGSSVMRAQLRRLLEVAELSHVTVQVLPFNVGGHAAAGGAFTILRLADEGVRSIAYLEQLTSAVYLDRPEDIDRYKAAMSCVGADASSPAATKEFLADLVREF